MSAKTRQDRPDEELIDLLAGKLQKRLEFIVELGADDPLFWRRAARLAAKKIGRVVHTTAGNGMLLAWVERTEEEARRGAREAIDRFEKRLDGESTERLG